MASRLREMKIETNCSGPNLCHTLSYVLVEQRRVTGRHEVGQIPKEQILPQHQTGECDMLKILAEQKSQEVN
jgi:hypothetical protein